MLSHTAAQPAKAEAPITYAREETPRLMTPARRAALEALEREFAQMPAAQAR